MFHIHTQTPTHWFSASDNDSTKKRNNFWRSIEDHEALEVIFLTSSSSSGGAFFFRVIELIKEFLNLQRTNTNWTGRLIHTVAALCVESSRSFLINRLSCSLCCYSFIVGVSTDSGRQRSRRLFWGRDIKLIVFFCVIAKLSKHEMSMKFLEKCWRYSISLTQFASTNHRFRTLKSEHPRTQRIWIHYRKRPGRNNWKTNTSPSREILFAGVGRVKKRNQMILLLSFLLSLPQMLMFSRSSSSELHSQKRLFFLLPLLLFRLIIIL